MNVSESVEKVRGRVGQQVDLVGAMLTVGIAGVIGYVLLFAMEKTESSVNTTTTTTINNTTYTNTTEFGQASQNLTQGITDAFGLAPVVFIIIFLTVAIGYLTLLRQRE